MTAKEFVRDFLKANADEKYREFNTKLMPTVEKSAVFGVRTPVLRKFAKEFFKDPRSIEFLNELPHRFFEENQLHIFLLEQIKDFDECIKAVEEFLPFIDNWATCDGFSPKTFKANTDKLVGKIEKWIDSKHTYTVRFAVVNLMRYYLDENFDPDHLLWVAKVNTDDYYLSMAVAWFYATALAKQYNKALPYLTNRLLDTKTHNKTVQKAVESFRLTAEQKEYLKTLRIR